MNKEGTRISKETIKFVNKTYEKLSVLHCSRSKMRYFNYDTDIDSNIDTNIDKIFELLDEIYQMAMTVMFRLLFIAYGEDKDLLPYRFNSLYKENSLKTIANKLLQFFETKHKFGSENIWWKKVQAIFEAVESGNSAWGIPAYNGGLFASDKNESIIGAAIKQIILPDYYFGPALQSLLL